MDPLAQVAEVFEEALREVSPRRLLVAFSGGLDSSALLLVARRYATAAGLPLRAVHVNHGVHPDASEWERHCRSVCAELGVALEIGRLELGPAPGPDHSEALLRAARYADFEARMRAGDVLLTGHHRDDVAETLLLNLLRGAGLGGLAAVPARRPLGAGLVVRPLLVVARADLLAVLRRAGVPWIEDPSNQDTAMRRNFIRHRVLPLLRERWPGAAATLARASVLTREAADLLDRSLQRDLARLRTADRAVLALDRLARLDAPRQRAVLRLWLRELGIAPPPRARLVEILRQLTDSKPGAQPLAELGEVQLRRHRHALHALKPPPPIDSTVRVDWHETSVQLPAGAGTLEWRRDDGSPLTAAEVPSLNVRFATTVRRLKPAGQRHRRAFKSLFQEAGLPPWDRPRCPLIHAGERLLGLGDLYWTDEFESLQRRLGARYRWQRPPLLDPPAPLG